MCQYIPTCRCQHCNNPGCHNTGMSTVFNKMDCCTILARAIPNMQQQMCHGSCSIEQVQFYLKLEWELHFKQKCLKI